jgi:sugar/nucleoside kinase (ribokinase family)
MLSLNIDPNRQKFKAMIGTGGIGSGSFFALKGDHTLGREESRAGRFVDRKDYCKLHIISHYVKVLTGNDFSVIPIGMVGDDEPGKRVYNEMEKTGLDMSHVTLLPGEQTLFSFCFIYPDESGGNLTVDDSASSRVSPQTVKAAEDLFSQYKESGLALAAPEVPLPAREELLSLASEHGLFRAASFTSEEMHYVMKQGLLKQTDLVAINMDEAACAADLDPSEKCETIVQAAIDVFKKENPDILISITGGNRGSWAWNGSDSTHVPIIEAEVKSTAGAGDAHFSGILAGLAAGLDLGPAQELGTLTAALSVTSPHTINPDINRETLLAFTQDAAPDLNETVRDLLAE